MTPKMSTQLELVSPSHDADADGDAAGIAGKGRGPFGVLGDCPPTNDAAGETRGVVLATPLAGIVGEAAETAIPVPVTGVGTVRETGITNRAGGLTPPPPPTDVSAIVPGVTVLVRVWATVWIAGARTGATVLVRVWATGATVLVTVLVTGARELVTGATTGATVLVTGARELVTGATTGATVLVTGARTGATVLVRVWATGATVLVTGATTAPTGLPVWFDGGVDDAAEPDGFGPELGTRDERLDVTGTEGSTGTAPEGAADAGPEKIMLKHQITTRTATNPPMANAKEFSIASDLQRTRGEH